ncbi:hypothetical protein LRS74_24810 [Streptomyces sp. LX-29]|uniref:hypothetical protein n=1 Tax=Streptomyces sp. LX-29 TaxID=2900152 RepID=UPI00240DC358|nr:hypothetical protein [Streptomyces sp. LX-29]WFB09902.1 hypothetical protein LRS74_24810 [Streptomyces sp. LX-29]
MDEQLARRAPLLVVLDAPEATVPVLSEELARAPRRVYAALTREEPMTASASASTGPAPLCATSPRGEEVTDLRVPLLDWLPGPLRRRGLDFLAESEEALARTPRALLPALLTEEDPAPSTSVRFARRLLPGALSEACLAAAVRHLFPAVRNEPGQPAGPARLNCA